jgi:DNA-directed RNA polymerase specialized sigma24 family protein
VVDVMDRLDSLTDAELVARTASDMEAFAAFYRRHVGWVLRVAARRTGSREHAGDLTAEVFAAAMLSAGRFRSERVDGQANNWLFGILLHKLSGFERRGAVERRARERLQMASWS